jgi:hypothetical protein
MPQPDRAWWDDVQYLREPLERKREKEARRGLRLDARAAARAVAERHAAGPVADAELDSIDELDAMPRTRRFERSAPDGDAAPRSRRFERSAPDTDAAPRSRRFERSAPDGDAAARSRRFERSAPDGDAAPRSRRFERAPERRGRFARVEHSGAARPADAPVPLPVPSRRRTIEITGRTVGAPALPRLVQIDRRRPARRPAERVGARPDRLALWAVVLGFFLIFVAVTSTSHAATRAHSAGAAGSRVVHQQVVRTHTAALRAIPPAR